MIAPIVEGDPGIDIDELPDGKEALGLSVVTVTESAPDFERASPPRYPLLDVGCLRSGPEVLSLVLAGSRGVFRVSMGDFLCLLQLALVNGWQPLGTEPAYWVGPDGEVIDDYGDASGRYDWAMGQIVGELDVDGIRAALCRAIADPSSRSSRRGRRLLEDFLVFIERGAFAVT